MPAPPSASRPCRSTPASRSRPSSRSPDPMGRADWITERPVAHRGLHDIAAGIVENTASAFEAAVAGGYAMECDVQISADGEAMVFHDDRLDRLMDASGPVGARTAAELRRIAMKAGRDRMIDLGELCDIVGGRR